MHPAIRIISIIIAIAFLAVPAWKTVLLIFISSLVLLIFRAPAVLPASLKVLWRLKWLYFSILIVYGWFTPGEPVITWTGIHTAYMPTMEGLSAAILRICVLLAIVIMVTAIMQSVEKERLVCAISWLASPLRILAVSPQRFALLLVMTLDKVLVSETRLREYQQHNRQKKGLLTMASTTLADALKNIEDTTGQVEEVEIDITDISAPPLWQWTFPLALVVLLYLLTY